MRWAYTVENYNIFIFSVSLRDSGIVTQKLVKALVGLLRSVQAKAFVKSAL